MSKKLTKNPYSQSDFTVNPVSTFLKPTISEFTKTLYNLGTIAFSLNRYVKIKRDKSKFFSKLEKLTHKKYFIFAFIFSFLINLYMIFEYNYNLKKSPELFYNLES